MIDIALVVLSILAKLEFPQEHFLNNKPVLINGRMRRLTLLERSSTLSRSSLFKDLTKQIQGCESRMDLREVSVYHHFSGRHFNAEMKSIIESLI